MHFFKRFRQRLCGTLAAALILGTVFGAPAQANVLDDVRNKIAELNERFQITNTLKEGWGFVSGKASDLIFSYDAQPDDDVLQKLAQSWAVTEYLTGENKGKAGIYYFDNNTMTMVEDLTQIGHGYNKKKTPEGSTLHGAKTGVLRATVMSASACTVEWVNYEDEVTQMLLRKMAQKQEAQSEGETEQEP